MRPAVVQPEGLCYKCLKKDRTHACMACLETLYCGKCTEAVKKRDGNPECIFCHKNADIRKAVRKQYVYASNFVDKKRRVAEHGSKVLAMAALVLSQNLSTDPLGALERKLYLQAIADRQEGDAHAVEYVHVAEGWARLVDEGQDAWNIFQNVLFHCGVKV